MTGSPKQVPTHRNRKKRTKTPTHKRVAWKAWLQFGGLAQDGQRGHTHQPVVAQQAEH